MTQVAPTIRTVPQPLIRAYVDETGDRGMKESSSAYFAFCAVIVRDSNVPQLTADLDALVAKLRKEPQRVLHWSRNIKDHADRKLAANSLAQLPVRLIYVVAPKTAIRSGSYLARSTEGYYNYMARYVIERLARFTKRMADREGQPDLRCKVTFGQVKGFNPNVLRSYISRIRRTRNDAPWDYLTPTIDVEGQGTTRLLQWAEIGAGALDSAIKMDRHAQYEPAYWLPLMPRIDQCDGRMLGYGLKVLGDESWLTNLPWWNPQTR